MAQEMETGTILGRKRANLTIEKEEVLMMLRAYQLHPCSWGEIIDDVKENLSKLPGPVREHYKQASVKQLRERLSLKLRKLMSSQSTIKDDEIRAEVNKVCSIEMRHASKQPTQSSAGPTPGPSSQSPSTSSSNSRKRMSVSRDHIAQNLSDEEIEEVVETPKKKKKKSLVDTIKENHEKYNKFMTKKLPKLLAVFGVESDSDSQ